MTQPLVLSLFPGIGLLDRAFEIEDFCILRGPDVLWGGDVRNFHPPAGVFDGVIGGPPCKPFSPLARVAAARWGESSIAENLIPEFERCIAESRPRWFLMENVRRAPLPAISRYQVFDVLLDNRWIGEGIGGEQSRVRRFSFGTADGRRLDISPEIAVLEASVFEYAITASSNTGGGAGLQFSGNGSPHKRKKIDAVRAASRRTLEQKCVLQGLPAFFLADAPFTNEGKARVIGNGVPLPMGRAIARAVKRAMGYAEAAA